MTDPHQLNRTPSAPISGEGARPSVWSGPLVPVTVVGGYLGAGKTTLINSLLAGDHGRRLAVLVNDFGSVNIDADLIATHDGQTISLENGCVCCSMADAMGDALDRVLALDPPPEQIIVEASGVADPAKVAIYGRGWPGCRLDAVIVLADATTVRASADDRFVGSLILRQLRGGDVVILTKTDLVDDDRLAETSGWIRGIAPDAELLPIDGDTDLAPLLLAHGRSAAPLLDPAGSSNDTESDADELFVSTVLTLEQPVAETELRSALLGLPREVVRVKGFALVVPDLATPPTTVTVHKVGDRVEIEPTTVVAGEAAPQLVAISVRGDLDADASPFVDDPLWRVCRPSEAP